MGARYLAVVACLAVGLCVLGERPATAQKPDYEAAKAAYVRAEKAMDKGEFAIAAREFGTAYEITKDPVLFYRIAEAHEKAGDCDTAVVYYRRYVRDANPDDEYKRLVDQALKRCGAAGGDATGGGTTGGGTTGGGTTGGGTTGGTTGGDTTGGTTGGGATTGGSPDFAGGGDSGGTGAGSAGAGGPPVVDDDQPSWKRTAAWVSVGATVAFVTTGAVLGLSASSRQEDIEQLIDFRDADGDPAVFDGTIREKYDDLVDEGEQLDLLSKVAFGVAGAAAISAAVFFVLDAQSTSSSSTATASSGRRLTPLVGARGELGVSLGWEF